MKETVQGFDLSRVNESFRFDVDESDTELRVQMELTSVATTNAVLIVERSLDMREWENPSAGLATLSPGATSAKLIVEAPHYRIKITTAGSSGDYARLTAQSRRAH